MMIVELREDTTTMTIDPTKLQKVQEIIDGAYQSGYREGYSSKVRADLIAELLNEPSTTPTETDPEDAITFDQLATILEDYVATAERNPPGVVVLHDMTEIANRIKGFRYTELEIREALDMCPAGARRWRFNCEDKTHLSCMGKP